MPEFNIATMEAYIKNFAEVIKTNPQIRDFKEIETRENYILFYYAMNMGVMSDRDVVCELKMQKEANGDYTSIAQSIKHPDHPEVKGRIRMDFLKASRCRDIDGKLEILEFSNMDMKGYFPMKMMNMFMGSAIAKSIPELHKAMNKYKVEWILFE